MEALVKKGIAICDLIEAQNKGQSNGFATVSSTDADAVIVDESVCGEDVKLSPTAEQLYSEVDQVFTELSKLIDPYDQKVAKFTERHALLHRHYGRALKLFGKLQETKATQEIELKTIEVCFEFNAFKSIWFRF